MPGTNFFVLFRVLLWFDSSGLGKLKAGTEQSAWQNQT